MLLEVEACLGDAERRALRRQLPDVFEPAPVRSGGRDVVRPEARLCDKLTGRDEAVFDWLERRVLPLLPGGAELLRTHYDLLRYRPGGFFAPHVDFSPLGAERVQVCQALLCLSEAPCGGGETAYFQDGARRASAASKTPGGLLVLAAGVRHEGCLVTSGEKLVLKFDVLARVPGEVDCRCTDGELRCRRATLLRSSYLAGLLRFRGERRLAVDLSVRELADVCAHLEARGSARGSARELHARLRYMAEADATALTAEEFELLGSHTCLRTEDGDAARRWLALAAHADFAFLHVVCWVVYDDEDYSFSHGARLQRCVALGPSGRALLSWEEEAVVLLGCGGSAHDPPQEPEEVVDAFILRALKEQEESGYRGAFPTEPAARETAPYLQLDSAGAELLVALAHRSPLLGRPDGEPVGPRKWLDLSRASVEENCNDGDGALVYCYHHVGYYSEWWLVKR